MDKLAVIYVLSDAIGETAEMVARAAASQFSEEHFEIIRIPYIKSIEQIAETIQEAAKHHSVICHTIVSSELRTALLDLAEQYEVVTVDIMGPMIFALQNISNTKPKLCPGLVHKLDQDYFKRVEAVEFAVKYDDGKNPWGILKADMVIVGVSRTSKTPLSMYLANKKLKVVNIPMVPGVTPPEQLFEIPPERVVGLIVDPSKLNNIRVERLKKLGLAVETTYSNPENITDELEYAKSVMKKIGCPIIDVTGQTIEETANKILEIARKNAD
ncbi:MAG: kinase/pyrophosphorylase [Pelosinus sp.]|nr:kinase/pyrophosphorylase [Pelosinus sp.]